MATQQQFEQKTNYGTTYLRCLIAGFLDHLRGKVRWVNEFTTGPVEVVVPFYYSLAGNDRFVQDAFFDDAAGKRVESNTDQIPRGVISIKNFAAKGGEFSNPNVPLLLNHERGDQLERVIVDVKPVPVTVSFEVKIVLDSERDFFECWQRLMDTMWVYRSFAYEYQRVRLDADVGTPSDYENPTVREYDLKTDGAIVMTLTMDVHTMYPIISWDRATPARPVDWNAKVWEKRRTTPLSDPNLDVQKAQNSSS